MTINNYPDNNYPDVDYDPYADTEAECGCTSTSLCIDHAYEEGRLDAAEKARYEAWLETLEDDDEYLAIPSTTNPWTGDN